MIMRRLPKKSEIAPAGKLISIPGIVDAITIQPISWGVAPRCAAKSGSTGVFDNVELRMASAPIDAIRTKKFRAPAACSTPAADLLSTHRLAQRSATCRDLAQERARFPALAVALVPL